MKTIDEVIKTLELCINDDNPCSKCPYTEYDMNGEWSCSMCGNFGEDALHYLKEYRNNYNNIININKDYFYLKKEMEEWYNKVFKPLSWDELKNLIGKPVWIEKNSTGAWYVIQHFVFNEAVEYMLTWPFYQWTKDEINNSWKAYIDEKKRGKDELD